VVSQDTGLTAHSAAVSNSCVLWQKIALAQPRLDFSSHRFWTDPHLAALLPRFLLELHSIVRGGLTVMQIALQRADELAGKDPVASALAQYLSKHISEERDHDTWLLDDMTACGVDRQLALSRVIPGPVAALLGAQTYWVLQEHPIAFLGYIAVIEGNPPTREHLALIRDQTGFPDEAFRCLREHADADQGHAADLRDLIDAWPLSPRHHQLLALSAFETIEALARIFDQLCREGKTSGVL
jgi:Iron-containing redox enzyme